MTDAHTTSAVSADSGDPTARKVIALSASEELRDGPDLAATISSMVGFDVQVDVEARALENLGSTFFGPPTDEPAPVCSIVELWLSGEAALTDVGFIDGLRDTFGWIWVGAVRQTIQLSPGRSTASGLLHVGLLHRRAGTSRQEFDTHWNTKHAPLVLSRAPRFTAYVTNVVLGDDGFWDGVVEQWYPSIEAFEQHRDASYTTKQDVATDIPRFLSYVQSYRTTVADWPEVS